MSNYRHKFLRKPSAWLVMGLMIFINAVKLFHTHSDFNTSQLSARFKSNFQHQDISQSNRCPICEFNLVKDADISYAEIPLLSRASEKVLFNSAVPFTLHQFAILSKGRAPPSTIS